MQGGGESQEVRMNYWGPSCCQPTTNGDAQNGRVKLCLISDHVSKSHFNVSVYQILIKILLIYIILRFA